MSNTVAILRRKIAGAATEIEMKKKQARVGSLDTKRFNEMVDCQSELLGVSETSSTIHDL